MRFMGRARIQQELRMKGIDSETAESALAELSEEEQDAQALAFAEKLLRRHHDLAPSDAIHKSLSGMRRTLGYRMNIILFLLPALFLFVAV